MGLNLGQTLQDARDTFVNYEGSSGRTAPRDRGITPEQAHRAAGLANTGVVGGSVAGGLSGNIAQSAQDAFAPPPAAAAAPAAPQVAGSSPTATAAAAPTATKVAETGAPNPYPSQPSPVDELMGYTRMGSRTRPVSPTSGGPSGIPKGGP